MREEKELGRKEARRYGEHMEREATKLILCKTCVGLRIYGGLFRCYRGLYLPPLPRLLSCYTSRSMPRATLKSLAVHCTSLRALESFCFETLRARRAHSSYSYTLDIASLAFSVLFFLYIFFLYSRLVGLLMCNVHATFTLFLVLILLNVIVPPFLNTFDQPSQVLCA